MKNIILLFLLLPFLCYSQRHTTFSGMVVNEEDEALIGATVNWQDTTIGGTTDIDGWFEIPRLDTVSPHILEINYVGYETAIVEILPDENRLKLVVKQNVSLEDVTVEATERASFTSTLNPINTESLGQGELRKAACCNLSESFQNNATVNVGYTDAVTGAKEIEMLGLRGTYTQMQIENRPSFNRLGRAYGLEYIPGTFIESIQISKGASNVRNGIKGITGQINTELIKPHKAPLLFINLFTNYTGRVELNTQFNYQFSPNWSTGLLMHGNYYGSEFDYNKDAFLDIPKKKQANVISRWMYKNTNLHFEFNVQGIWDSRSGGQTANLYQKVHDSTATQLYQISSEIRRIGVFGKLGYLGFRNPSQSIAFIYDANYHQHQSYFGNTTYYGLQKQLYGNLIFQTNLGNNKHNLTTGLTYDLIDFEEQFSDINSDRTEHTTSAYAEYDFSQENGAFGLLLGVRGDMLVINDVVCFYPVPRLNIKYNFTSDMVLRASAGRGVRNPNVLIENIRYMPSNRAFEYQENIMPEVAWNYGANFTWGFNIGPKYEGNITIDFYRTDFENQLIADLDSDAQKLTFYNLNGQSFANSFLVSYTSYILKGLEVRLAYKYNDVRMTIGSQLLQVPLMPQHRGLVHLSYTTPKKDWAFNVTMNAVGPQRLPALANPTAEMPAYRKQAVSPAYVLLNAHITKFFKGGWEVYIGGENLTNYTQEAPIMGANDPFGRQSGSTPFDAATVFAPVFGAQVYAGVKYTLQGKKRFEPIEPCQSTMVKQTPSNNKASVVDASNKETINIQSSVQCGMCTETIQKALYSLDGLGEVKVDLDQKIITVTYDKQKLDGATIRQAITEAGYDADKQQADPTAYQNLHGCCKKPEDR